MFINASILVFLITNFLSTVVCELFSSIEKLQQLAISEKVFLEELRAFASLVNDDYVDRKLKAWQEDHELMEKNVMDYITNPLNAYLMIKRATSDIKLIEQRFPEESKTFSGKIKRFQPGADDLAGAVDGLLRLQTVYKLDSVDFSNGIIDGEKTRKALTAHDLYVIGDEALKLEAQEYFALDYLEIVYAALSNKTDSDLEVDEDTLLHQLTTYHYNTGNLEESLSYAKLLAKKTPDSIELKEFIDKLVVDLVEYGDSLLNLEDPFSEYFEKDGQMTDQKENILYSKACRGKVVTSLVEQAKLHCRYESSNYFSKLARFKVEELNLEPRIVLFVDILTDSEIESLKSDSRMKIKRAKVAPNGNETGETTNYRVAQHSWHFDSQDKIYSRISQRIEDATGLTQKTSEPLQVQNYGLGGHYAPHWDHRIKRDIQLSGGNRIATMLFYMSDVEKGGATIMPYLKIYIPARKGSAVFWYNLKVNGEGDYFTKHAGCPVLLGNKWVANKWIREHGQEFRRPCVPEEFIDEPEEIYHRDIF